MPLEYRVGWTGTPAEGGGVTVLHCRSAAGATTAAAATDFANRVKSFFDSVKTRVVGGVTWSFPPEVTELDTTTGQLEAVHAVTAPTDVVTTGSSTSYARPCGARVDWLTPAIVNGRRLRGRSFFVPIPGGEYDGIGSLQTTTVAAWEAAANVYKDTGFFTSSQPCVWSRTHGILADITAINVPDRATILRSRRD